jgi:site-specific recombinase XerD
MLFRLHKILKRFFAKVPNTLPGAEVAKAAHIRLASMPWLRHTFATPALKNGASLKIVRGLFGHKSRNTALAYITAERDHRSREIGQFSNFSDV